MRPDYLWVPEHWVDQALAGLFALGAIGSLRIPGEFKIWQLLIGLGLAVRIGPLPARCVRLLPPVRGVARGAALSGTVFGVVFVVTLLTWVAAMALAVSVAAWCTRADIWLLRAPDTLSIIVFQLSLCVGGPLTLAAAIVGGIRGWRPPPPPVRFAKPLSPRGIELVTLAEPTSAPVWRTSPVDRNFILRDLAWVVGLGTVALTILFSHVLASWLPPPTLMSRLVH